MALYSWMAPYYVMALYYWTAPYSVMALYLLKSLYLLLNLSIAVWLHSITFAFAPLVYKNHSVLCLLLVI